MADNLPSPRPPRPPPPTDEALQNARITLEQFLAASTSPPNLVPITNPVERPPRRPRRNRTRNPGNRNGERPNPNPNPNPNQPGNSGGQDSGAPSRHLTTSVISPILELPPISWSPASLAAALERIINQGCPLCLEEGANLVEKATPVAVLTTSSSATTSGDQNQDLEQGTEDEIVKKEGEDHQQQQLQIYHAFCQGCIFRWFVTRNTCPFCRVRQSAPILLTEDLLLASSAALKCGNLAPSAELLAVLHTVYMRNSTWRPQAYFYCYAAEVLEKFGGENLVKTAKSENLGKELAGKGSVKDAAKDLVKDLAGKNFAKDSVEDSNLPESPVSNQHLGSRRRRRPKWLTYNRFCRAIHDLSHSLETDLEEAEEALVMMTFPGQRFPYHFSMMYNHVTPQEQLLTYFRCFLYMYGYQVVVDQNRGFQVVIDEDGNVADNEDEDEEEEEEEYSGQLLPIPLTSSTIEGHFNVGRRMMKDFFVEDLVMLNWVFPVVVVQPASGTSSDDRASEDPYFANWPEFEHPHPANRAAFFPEPAVQHLKALLGMVTELVDRSWAGSQDSDGSSEHAEGSVPNQTSESRIKFQQSSFAQYFTSRLYFPSFSSKKASADQFRALYDEFARFAGSPYRSQRMFLLNGKFELKKRSRKKVAV